MVEISADALRLVKGGKRLPFNRAGRSRLLGGALGGQLLGFFGDALLGPVVVAARLACAVALGLFHLLHQVHVGREERDALADYLLTGLESLVRHKLRAT